MKPIFSRGPSLQLRLLLALIVSVALIYTDSHFKPFSIVRGYLASLVSPLQYVANSPREFLDDASDQLVSAHRLRQENVRLKQQLRLQQAQLLTMANLQKENGQLRSLLGSPVHVDGRRMVAEILAVDSDPFSQQVVINKGSQDGVYQGQPVINDVGVVGFIVHVATASSRVLLISDSSAAVPVRVMRNDIRVIAEGNGDVNSLRVPNVPRSTDIKVGDELVTSGLGGRFPEGYPVAKVTQFRYQEGRPFASIEAKPVVNLERLRYLLLLWPDKTQLKQPVPQSNNTTKGAK
ncbi:rod shape-determining protein MreC [Celerinatantimonas sp. MCCC 1A17872]|uniref:rod shape-determining protein MreC n=1 Tax=Celerinatantimonas sp. MCCC 1A17872 TaxID=3177514 RepID=UPI0038C70C2D